MRLLLDHCVWKQTIQTLAKAGFSCVTLRDLDKTEARNSEVLALARQQSAILITRDRDFTDLSHYPLGTHAGIVWLDITPADMNEVHAVQRHALRTLTADQLAGTLLIVTPTTYRLRHPARSTPES